MQAAPVPEDYAFEVAVATDVGTQRTENEDHCAQVIESATAGMVAIADGVSGMTGGGTASQKAIETTLRTYRALGALGGMRPARRLQRAVQQANIDVYDLAVVVPELRGMATTLTAMVVDRGTLLAAHVGDCRIYLLRQGRIRQLTKDHTVVADRVRLGLMTSKRALSHPDRSVLTRSVGRELIVAIDRIAAPLLQEDQLILCSDGLYNVLDDPEIAETVRGQPAGQSCRALIAAANARGTPDNLTAAVVCMTGATPAQRPLVGLRARLGRLLGRDS